MNYYISDLHFFHRNVTGEGTNFDKRPFATMEEMHETIKENWNNRVTGSDHVYILGDMCWRHDESSISLVAQLKGQKSLILGNHDQPKDQRYRQLFNEIVPYKELDDVIDGKKYGVVLSHFPIAFWNHQHKYTRDGNEHKRWAIQLYGHVHNSVEEDIFREFLNGLNIKYGISCEAYNVGCMMDYIGYTPRTLKEIREGWKVMYKSNMLYETDKGVIIN